MAIWFGAMLVVALQQEQAMLGYSSPPNGDTVGYWQQRVSYTITATLDERAQKVQARGRLWYVNNSPDTLREMYVHQYLNAFRPASKWSQVDEREGRERFQQLREPNYGYERFTAPVLVNGTGVTVTYPGAPDSTVARLALPTPLAPRDSLYVDFEWDARPSTVPRRQGRRGRHWDLAQWYPKVAVYDRGGWEYNALQPAGEFYGEFGSYDVTLVVRGEQVIGATGVPVSGDPGWSRAIRGGVARAAANAYRELPPPPPPPPAHDVPVGYKAVRFVARDVHHFAWSASPDYRYEGGIYTRRLSPTTHFPTWDTVVIHALYRPGDDSTWGGGRVVRRTIAAMQWLETIYGSYAYPQMTVLHRLDGGGTEFPMMQMNGSPSQGLILHEGGHVFTYGILANNEWRSGWMDEGLTSYQTDWAQLFTPQERLRAGIVDRPVPVRGYRARGIRMALPRFERIALDQITTDLRGESQPIGTVAHEFRDFNTYNDMIYDRAQLMYGQLRDVLGDTVFGEFLHDYYARWALKHVDERAMRASAERVSGRDLGWFFDQWVHRTGVMDYALEKVRQSRDSSGGWVTEAVVARRGKYRHQMSVGVRTVKGWTFSRVSNEVPDRQTLRITTPDEPLEVRLDPFHFSWDWDRRDDVYRPFKPFDLMHGARMNFDWPFLNQADRERSVVLYRPMLWYSEPGGVHVGIRERASYLGWLDLTEAGLAAATGKGGNFGNVDLALEEQFQYWLRFENPTLKLGPAVGWRLGAARLDAVNVFEVGRRRGITSVSRSRVTDLALTGTSMSRLRTLVPEQWSQDRTIDLSARARWRFGRAGRSYSFIDPSGIAGVSDSAAYWKLEFSVGRVQIFSDDARVAIRGYVGASHAVPGQRALLLSASDPISTFGNHWWRPRRSILKQPGVNWLPLGGAVLRGFDWTQATDRIAAANLELSRRVGSWQRDSVSLSMSAFGDAAYRRPLPAGGADWLSDAGVGLKLRARLYDQPIVVRFDFPFFVNQPSLAIDRGRAGSGQLAPRWVISFNDIW
jgi:hypothetical protein